MVIMKNFCRDIFNLKDQKDLLSHENPQKRQEIRFCKVDTKESFVLLSP